jgi:CheY-like chemotaxis protein
MRAGLSLRMSKILIVEDNREHSMVLTIKLKAHGYDVVAISDCASVVDKVTGERPDAILLDLGLPTTDGYAVLKLLRESQHLSQIPVVIVSGRERRFNRDKAIRSGASAFLQKPVETEELLDLLRQLLAAPV